MTYCSVLKTGRGLSLQALNVNYVIISSLHHPNCALEGSGYTPETLHQHERGAMITTHLRDDPYSPHQSIQGNTNKLRR